MWRAVGADDTQPKFWQRNDRTVHSRNSSAACPASRRLAVHWEFFKVENNSLELTRIFKESFRDQRWAWEESVRAEKRDRDAEREKETFRRQRHHQTDDGVDAETSLSLSLSASLSLFSALTLSSHAHLWSLKLSLKVHWELGRIRRGSLESLLCMSRRLGWTYPLCFDARNIRLTATAAFIHCVYVCQYEGMRDMEVLHGWKEWRTMVPHPEVVRPP